MQDTLKHIDIQSSVDLSSILLRSMSASKHFEDLIDALADKGNISAGGLPGSLCSVLIAALTDIEPITVVAADSRRAEELLDDLSSLLDENDVLFLPPDLKKSGLKRLTPESAAHHRAETFRRLVTLPPKVLMVLPGTLMETFPTLTSLRERTLRIKVGGEIEPMELMKKLLNAGFRREVQVAGCGEAALRGGILDMFPYGYKAPLRLEFWGNEIISLRNFDPRSQRSMKEIEESEIILDRDRDESEKVFSLMDGIVFWDNYPEISSRYKRIIEDDIEPIELLSLDRKYIIYNSLASGDISFKGIAGEMFLGSTATFGEKVKHHIADGLKILVGTESDHRSVRFAEFASEAGDEILDSVELGVLPLQDGFIFPEGKIAFFTEHELFDRPRPKRSFARFRTYAHPIEPEALKKGDYVVHADYGIGVYQSLKKIEVAGNERECLHIKYRDGVNLYVRLEAFDKVRKYSGREGFVPAISKIGGREWQKTQQKAKKAIMDMARELLAVQAQRVIRNGNAFEPDDLWQKELEESFEYEDTVDQSRVSLEIKSDMENGRPMDRLLLGDVGFGKTEIAIRAAFKAVRSNKQVAVLAPTTILVQQHLQTFRERMEKYPVIVESLSRFKTQAEQRKIVQGLRSGAVDIVVGTHRLLSKDVSFRRLGLLIVDEEHRFGVRHKERLKQLRYEIDVLTLTATPIPRTLHQALLGARDLSRIETPPEDRRAIITEVLPFDRGLIREAVLAELKRKGQVFFIHNRVRSIEAIKSMLMRIAPEASYSIAHGQMKAKDLENVMLAFMDKKFDVLICTMIIESGIDLPNVNTMIINRADKLGLAQLYQLRGRIGRSDRQAYAYMLIPPKLNLSTEARSRLETIAQFTDLGAGFQVALRDLEIRGAGNLLGSQQSGFINSVGFDLYSQMLEEAIENTRMEIGETGSENRDANKSDKHDVKIEIDCDAHIPADYLFEQDLRVNIYRRLAACGTLDELNKLDVEMADRFGPLPVVLNNLLAQLRLKILAFDVQINKLTLLKNVLSIEMLPKDEGYSYIIQNAISSSAGRQIEFSNDEPFRMKLMLNDDETIESKLEFTEKFVSGLAAGTK